MDQSCSESDISMSPSQLLERLQMLRQLQLMQRGKLQKQRLQYQNASETSSSITEIISHFSNSLSSTSYNTFRSLLQSPTQNRPAEDSPRPNISDTSQKLKENDLIEGISVLNLSKESEFILTSPSTNSARSECPKVMCNGSTATQSNQKNSIKQISLDEMPIQSPKKDFEALVIEKIQSDNTAVNPQISKPNIAINNKKTFLKRGEGMTRFGLKKDTLVIQNTKSLPWRRKSSGPNKKIQIKPIETAPSKKVQNNNDNLDINFVTKDPKFKLKWQQEPDSIDNKILNQYKPSTTHCENNCVNQQNSVPENIIELPKGKHPLQAKKGKTWAAILTKEQNDFLSQLKQSDYYKNFVSPTKSTITDVSCDENFSKLTQDRELAEQNLFELLENKVSQDSFNLENSFFNRFLKQNNLENSGESTPLIMQKCLSNNPNLLHIFPDYNGRQKKDSFNDAETYQTDCTECCSDTCSSVSSCCSCRTVEATPQSYSKTKKVQDLRKNSKKEVAIVVEDKKDEPCQNDIDKNDAIKADMVEMNAKLITTSELLKDRLRELEDEIETFRKENINLNKLREEVDVERQQFYEEKKAFEQKFNEEKILSEYYIAEEKEKLNKQKLMYERYVREMRGRLNKKEKDEVVNLKQEINSLKEEIRVKDAKSTSTIARLRNQLKIMEKEKATLQNEVEKLKKENRRIQHSNDITRRMSNMKYLQEINKKLSNIGKETQSEVEVCSDVKYKAFEIERQSRSRKAQQSNNTIRPRAKSVPNLKVTSRYAKYFSQRDSASHVERNKTLHVEPFSHALDSDEENIDVNNFNFDENESVEDEYKSELDTDNNLEKIYMETFRTTSPTSNRSSLTNSHSNSYSKESSTGNYNDEQTNHKNGFFLQKSNSMSSSRNSKSPTNISPYTNYDNSSNRSKSPVSILSNKSRQKSPLGDSNNTYRSKSPVTILSGQSSQHLSTVIHNDYRDKLMSISPEPSTSKTSLTKTNLNPSEIRNSDGSKELRFPNGNVKYISADGKYTKFLYYNGDVKENFLNDGRIKYFYSQSKTYHTTHADGLEVLEFPDGQIEKRYKDGSSEIRLPNGSVRYHDPKNQHVREEWRFPDGAALTISANGEQRIVFGNGQIEVHAKDHKRREFPDGTVKLVYNDGTSETRYASGRVRIKDKHGNLIMDSASR